MLERALAESARAGVAVCDANSWSMRIWNLSVAAYGQRSVSDTGAATTKSLIAGSTFNRRVPTTGCSSPFGGKAVQTACPASARWVPDIYMGIYVSG